MAVDRKRYKEDAEYRAQITANNRASYARRQAELGKIVHGTGPTATRGFKYKGLTHSERGRLQRCGCTPQQFLQMYETQEGKCAICTDPIDGAFRAHVDHCHVTGKIRGILCPTCNRCLGLLKDDVSLLQAALKYLTA